MIDDTVAVQMDLLAFTMPCPEPASPLAAPYFRWHGAVNRLGAALLLVPGAPLIALSGALMRLTSPGPGIYRQIRVGRGGRTFMLYKIRTMRVDAEAGTGAVWTTSHRDPRITRLGRLLRLLHLDEFPQLWNVLRGEMALIGPRPERPEFTQLLVRQVPGYLDRLAVLPGITGLAQIQLPPDTDVESVKKKLAVDLEYVRRGSLWLDLRIFLCTLARLLGLSGHAAARLMGLKYNKPTAPPAGRAVEPVKASTLLTETVESRRLTETHVERKKPRSQKRPYLDPPPCSHATDDEVVPPADSHTLTTDNSTLGSSRE